MKKITIVALLMTLFSSYGFSQKYGKDSLECLKNLSTMSEFYKIKLYDYALNSWEYVFENCPAASKNMYIYGENIFEKFLEDAEKPKRVQGLLDTLMMIYDKRIEHFGQKGYVLGKKGIDLLKYDKDQIETAHDYLGKSIGLRGKKSSPAVIMTYMLTTVNLFKQDKLDNEQTLKNYTTVMDIMEAQLKADPGDPRLKSAKENIEEMFSKSGAATCENLVELYGPKFETNKEDLEFLKKITGQLEKTGCEDSKLFEQAAEKLYSLEPSAQAAYNLARLFISKNNYEKAREYLLESIKLEEDAEKKASYYYQLGVLESNEFKNHQTAVDYAFKAIKLKSGWGDPYILIGNAYAACTRSCGENKFERSAVYWVVVDQFIKAKNVDPSVADKADNLISRYSQYFPNQEDTFFHGYDNGDSYTVGCWINEKTTVRINK